MLFDWINWYPGLQLHLNEPIVLLQIWSHVSLNSAHSFISTQVGTWLNDVSKKNLI